MFQGTCEFWGGVGLVFECTALHTRGSPIGSRWNHALGYFVGTETLVVSMADAEGAKISEF